LRLNDVGLLQHLPYLGVLEIHNCSKLVSLEEKEVEEQLQLSLPSKLRKISISRCKALESLPKAMMDNNMHLEEVYISNCSSLTHFAIGQLPPTLKQLKIEGATTCRFWWMGMISTNAVAANLFLSTWIFMLFIPQILNLKWRITSNT
jgi:hypothetical protein